ncbi:MAG: HlyD family efflux transporter periplasmic adaptor subunit [Lentisphaerae bacterium]|nr:HlyD family efflux transporter periplasmic adaptor subunit [Lentisphaerota bacterium]
MINDDAAAKLRTMALVLKLGHDLFGAADFDDAALRAVNDSRVLLNFRSAALFTRFDGCMELAAQSGIPEKNPRSQLVLEQKKLLSEIISGGSDVMVLSAGKGLPETLDNGETVYFIMPLVPPGQEGKESEYIWLLEYSGSIPPGVEHLAKLLGRSIAEALTYHRLKGRKHSAGFSRRKKRIIRAVILLAAVAAVMFIRVPERATAEFTLIPEKKSPAYALFDGTIAGVMRQDGDMVAAGETVAEYDKELLEYRLEEAKMELAELDAQIALESRNSFTDSEKLGKVKLLELRRETARVAVKEAQWFLDNAAVKAPAAGVLVYALQADKSLSGRAVRMGDELFSVYGGEDIMLEIPVDEKDASLLQDKLTVTAFLHTAPERGIPVGISRISPYPELTGQKSYAYKVYGKMPENFSGNSDLRYGMRGTARLEGKNVSLFYWLFKSALLYFRGM